MLVSFSVSNFRSFKEEQTFTLVSSKRLGNQHSEHAVPIPGTSEEVLRAGVIYGPNGGGKSNLMKALRLLRTVAIQPRKNRRGIPRQPFRFADMSGEPTTLDLQFIVNNTLYRFGVCLNDERITQEWLMRVGTKEKPLYQRKTNEEGEVEISAEALENVNEKLAALVKVGGPENQTFLATIRATLSPDDAGDEIKAIIRWFHRSLHVISPGAGFGSITELFSQDPSYLDFASKFLKAASTGVDHLRYVKTELSDEEARSLVPKPLLDIYLENIGPEGGKLTNLGKNSDLYVNRESGSDRFYRMSLLTAHRHKSNDVATLEFIEESDGTQRLAELLPVLYDPQNSHAVFFIDEIERSMHTALVYKFIEVFLRSTGRTACQLIATTHETNLLNLNLLRRDEIWFAEKNQDGATQLYSLTDYQVRNDLQIRKSYLDGRFGAVPALDEIDQLGVR